MPKISCRVAQVSDYDQALSVIREFYYKEEKITVAHKSPGHTKEDEDFIMSHIYEGTMFVAIDEEKDGKIVGVVACSVTEHGETEKLLQDAESSTTKQWSDIQRLSALIEKKSDVLARYNIERALHGQAIAVDKDYRGYNIGTELTMFCCVQAKKMNFPLIYGDCTSPFSQKIAEDMGMELVSVVTYDEYNKMVGEVIFDPDDPEAVIKTYVIMLDDF